jgi:uncharacterized integral membrane protein
MKLINGEIYVFLVVLFISFIIIAIFDIIQPEDKVIMNYMPFPTISPKNLPGPLI